MDADATHRSGLRLPTVLAVAVLHVACLCALGLLFHARPKLQPPADMGIPVVFMPSAPEPHNSSPQIVASTTLPVPARREVAPLLRMPPSTLPPSQTASIPRASPGTPHRSQSHTPTSAPPLRNLAQPDTSKPAAALVARGLAAPAAPATPPHDIVLALAGWEARIRQAVQDAAAYPASARLLHRDGSAQVRFEYDRGAIENASIAQSSHFGALDNAALAAVTRAAIPGPPAELGAQKLTLLVWVQFRFVAEE